MRFQKGRVAWNRNKKRPPFSEEWKRHMSEGKKGKASKSKGWKHSLKSREKMSLQRRGENNSQWKGGISKKPGYTTFQSNKRRIRLIGAEGDHTQGEWENLKAQYNWTCPSCHKGEPKIILTEDHIIPLIRGGSNNIENIQPLCRSCNSSKHTQIIKYKNG